MNNDLEPVTVLDRGVSENNRDVALLKPYLSDRLISSREFSGINKTIQKTVVNEGMVSSSLRFSLCLFIGLITGSVLGILFVPDPTGIVAIASATAYTGLITWYLYQSEWLREETRVNPTTD